MTPKTLLRWSLITLGISGCGLVGDFVLGFAFFTHQGNDMDWISTVGEVFVATSAVSAFLAMVSGMIAVGEKEN